MFQFPPTRRPFTSIKRSRRQRLPFCLEPNLRIAQISSTSQPFDSAQTFQANRWDELTRFRPQALIGFARDLQIIAERVELGRLDLTSVDHAIFIVTECGNKPVVDTTRVVLWQTFGVPVYELFVSAAGYLLAAECEAYEGWHIQAGANFSVVHRKLIVDIAG